MPTYDLEEAKALFAREYDDLEPDTNGRVAASQALLDDLVSLGGTPTGPVTVNKNPKGVWVSSGGAGVFVRFDDRSGAIYTQAHQSGAGTEIVGLEYDPVTKLWEGEEPDTFHLAEPGKPVRRRSAVAVVLQEALERAKKGAR